MTKVLKVRQRDKEKQTEWFKNAARIRRAKARLQAGLGGFQRKHKHHEFALQQAQAALEGLNLDLNNGQDNNDQENDQEDRKQLQPYHQAGVYVKANIGDVQPSDDVQDDDDNGAMQHADHNGAREEDTGDGDTQYGNENSDGDNDNWVSDNEENRGDDDDDDDDENAQEDGDGVDGNEVYPLDEMDEKEEMIRNFFCCVSYKHLMSWEGVDEIWNFVRKHGAAIQTLSEDKRLRTLKTLRNEMERQVIKPTIATVYYVDRGGPNETWITEDDLTRLPRALADQRGVSEKYSLIKTYYKMPELVNFLREKVCSYADYTVCHVSVDGVAEVNQPDHNVVLASIAFEGCGTPHLFTHFKHPRGEADSKLTPEIVYDHIVKLLNSQDLTLSSLPTDGKERKFAKCMVPPGNPFNCDFCYAMGIRIEGQSARRTFYTHTELGAPFRTAEQLEVDARVAANKPQGQYYKGVCGRTPLFNLRKPFDPIWQVMHASSQSKRKPTAVTTNLFIVFRCLTMQCTNWIRE